MSTNKYQDFLERKHAELVTPDATVKDAVLKIVGSPLVSKARIVKGEVNEVYSGKTEDGQKIIIRVSHKGFSKFEREKWALGQSGSAGVPVPKVIGIVDYGTPDKHLNFCIQTFVEGEPFEEMIDLLKPENKSQLDNIMNQAGKVLYKIHQIRANGYGEFDKNGQSDLKSMQDYFTGSPYLSLDKMSAVARRVNLEPDVMSKAVNLLNDMVRDYVVEAPQLSHGDWAPKHILVKDDQITGIIDFEGAEGGDPAKDFAYWDYFYGDTYSLESMKIGYANAKTFNDNFENRLNIWRLYTGVTTLEYYADENHESGIDYSKGKLREYTRQL